MNKPFGFVQGRQGITPLLIVLIVAGILAIGVGGYMVAKKMPGFGPGSPNPNLQTPEQPLLGGDRDAHGCIGSAGYSWCEAKQKCLRPFEKRCDAATTTACIPEVKQCPDGSYVSRQGPNCEFTPCQTTATSTATIDTSSWHTYRNEKLGFEITVPPSFSNTKENSSTTVVFGVGGDFPDSSAPYISVVPIIYRHETLETIKREIEAGGDTICNKALVIAGQNAIRCFGPMGVGFATFKHPYDDRQYIIGWKLLEPEIVSTFKFL